MKTRYDYMTQGNAVDSEDNEAYPDPLSLNYTNYSITDAPNAYPHRIETRDITKFWLYMYRAYNTAEYDDILLDMNGIGYVGLLEPGSLIINWSMKDIKNFNTNKRKESEED